MLEIRTLLESFHIVIEILQPVVEDRVVMSYRPQVRFEVLRVNSVEADYGRISQKIELGEFGTKNIRAAVTVYQFF
jgi:hypothetical protein